MVGVTVSVAGGGPGPPRPEGVFGGGRAGGRGAGRREGARRAFWGRFVEAVAVMVGVTVSVAVAVRVPSVPKVMLGEARPAAKVTVAGKVASGSLEVRFAVPVYEVAV